MSLREQASVFVMKMVEVARAIFSKLSERAPHGSITIKTEMLTSILSMEQTFPVGSRMLLQQIHSIAMMAMAFLLT